MCIPYPSLFFGLSSTLAFYIGKIAYAETRQMALGLRT